MSNYMKISNPLRWDLTPQTFVEIMEIFKGILTDVEYRALSKFSKFDFFFFAYFRSPPLRSTIPKKN